MNRSFSNDPKRDSEGRSELDAAIRRMQQLGATICDPADVPGSERWKATRMSNEIAIIAHEFKEDMEKYLATMGQTDVATLRDIIE